MNRNPSEAVEGTAQPRKVLVAGMLRLRLMEFEAAIGLATAADSTAGPDLNPGHTLLSRQVDTPTAMLDRFAEQDLSMRRLGRDSDRAYVLEMGPYSVYSHTD